MATDNTRTAFAEIFLEAQECKHLDKCHRDDPNIGRYDARLNGVHGPQPGFLGANYLTRRLVLIGKNPGADSSGNVLHQARQMYELFGQFASNRSMEAFNAIMSYLAEIMPTWKLIRDDLRPGECSFSFPEDIAYLNVIKCATWRRIDGKYKDVLNLVQQVVNRCTSEYLSRQLAILAPRAVVCLGKDTSERLDRRILPQSVKFFDYIDRAHANTTRKLTHNDAVRRQLQMALGKA